MDLSFSLIQYSLCCISAVQELQRSPLSFFMKTPITASIHRANAALKLWLASLCGWLGRFSGVVRSPRRGTLACCGPSCAILKNHILVFGWPLLHTLFSLSREGGVGTMGPLLVSSTYPVHKETLVCTSTHIPTRPRVKHGML